MHFHCNLRASHGGAHYVSTIQNKSHLYGSPAVQQALCQDILSWFGELDYTLHLLAKASQAAPDASLSRYISDRVVLAAAAVRYVAVINTITTSKTHCASSRTSLESQRTRSCTLTFECVSFPYHDSKARCCSVPLVQKRHKRHPAAGANATLLLAHDSQRNGRSMERPSTYTLFSAGSRFHEIICFTLHLSAYSRVHGV